MRLLEGENSEAEDGDGEGDLDLLGDDGSSTECIEHGVARREDVSESSA